MISFSNSNKIEGEEDDVITSNQNAIDYSEISISSDSDEEFKDLKPYHFKDFKEDEQQLKMPLRDQLAPLIPKEIADVDVQKIFPYFKYAEILRFNKLFGSGKPTSLPKIWRNFNKRRKKMLSTYQQHFLDSDININEDMRNIFKEESLQFPEKDQKNIDLNEAIDDEIEFTNLNNNNIDILSHPTLYEPKKMEHSYSNKSETSDNHSSSTEEDQDSNPYDGLDRKAIQEGLFDPLTTVEWEKDVIIDTSKILGEDFDPVTGGVGTRPLNQILSAQFVKSKLGITEEDERYCGWLPTATIRSFQASLAHRQSILMVNSGGGFGLGGSVTTTNSVDNISGNLNFLFGLNTCAGSTLPAAYGLTNTMASATNYMRNRNNQQSDSVAENKFIPILSTTADQNDDYPFDDDYDYDWEQDVVLCVDDLKNDPEIVNAVWPPPLEECDMLKPKIYPPLPEDACNYVPVEVMERNVFEASNDLYYYIALRTGGTVPGSSTHSIPSQGSSSMTGFYLMECTGMSELGACGKSFLGLGFMQLPHATPASELWPAFYPTFMGPLKLKHFHRPIVKKYSHGMLSTESSFHTNHNQARIAALSAVESATPAKNTTGDDFFHAVNSVEERVARLKEQREKERISLGGGDMFFMHSPSDLSALDGELVLAEYSEEFPPLMMNFGMTTAIKNYHKRKPGKETNVQDFKHGTPAFSQTAPFLGSLAPGQRLQALENNMFRAPVYLHKFPSTDFLIIRTRNGYSIRMVQDIFTVGQECPLIEVPCPNSKKANQFLRDFLHVFLMRLFRASTERPPKVYMEQVKRAFPTIAENLLRKKLKSFADFDAGASESVGGRDSPNALSAKSSSKKLFGGNNKKSGGSGKYYGNELSMTKRFQKRFRVWTLRSDFRIPPEEELRELVRPEHACAWYSGLAAEARLLDAGYSQAQIQGLTNYSYNPTTGNTTLGNVSQSAAGSAGNNEDGNQLGEEEEEIKAAPWNTTRAFLSAIRGKCLLDLNGVADPTGRGQGFSYVRISSKARDEFPIAFGGGSANVIGGSGSNPGSGQLSTLTASGTASGANATTSSATAVITPGGYVSKKTVTGTDADLRKLSLKDAKQLLRNFDVPEEELQKLTRWEIIDVVRTLSTQQAMLGDDTVTKFARGQKMSATENQEKFKDECQRIFDLQNRVLASSEVLSTDEGSSTEDSDFEQMGKNIENMLANHKSKKTAAITSSQTASAPTGSHVKDIIGDKRRENKKAKHQSMADRKLRITRTFRNPEGKEFVRVETVRNPGVIEAYLRIRESKDPELLAYFSRPDESKKQEMLRERRRIIEQLKRLRAKEDRQRQRLLFGADMLNEDGVKERYKDKDTLAMDERKRIRKIHNLEAHFRDINEQINKMEGIKSDGQKKDSDDKDATADATDSKVKCGACGGTGHMKTNKTCPLYSSSAKAHFNVAMTQEEQESLYDIEKVGTFDYHEGASTSSTTAQAEDFNVELGGLGGGDLVNVEGTKIILSKTIIEHYDNVRRKSLILKFPKLSDKHELAKKYRGRKPHDPSKPRKPYTKSASFYAARLQHRGRPPNMATASAAERKKYTGGSKQFFKHHHPRNSNNHLQQQGGVKRGRPPLSKKGIGGSKKTLSAAQSSSGTTNMMGIPIRDIGALGMFAPHLAEIYSEAAGTGTNSMNISSVDVEDYLKKPHQSHKRRAIDPVVTLSSTLENILNVMRDLPNTQPFTHPVNVKTVPDYYQFVHKPMDLQTMRVKLHKRKYRSREDFLADATQIVENSRIYNGPTHPYTQTAEAMLELCVAKLAEKEEKLMKLEKSINPLLDENDAVALGFIFESIVREKLISNPDYWPFHNPVNPKVLKDYHVKIENPIDLSTIAKRAKSLTYSTREAFLNDIKLIATNSEIYNGPDSTYTNLARQINLDTLEEMQTYEENTNILQLEQNLAKVKRGGSSSHLLPSNNDDNSSNTDLIGMDEDNNPGSQLAIDDNVEDRSPKRRNNKRQRSKFQEFDQQITTSSYAGNEDDDDDGQNAAKYLQTDQTVDDYDEQSSSNTLVRYRDNLDEFLKFSSTQDFGDGFSATTSMDFQYQPQPDSVILNKQNRDLEPEELSDERSNTFEIIPTNNNNDHEDEATNLGSDAAAGDLTTDSNDEDENSSSKPSHRYSINREDVPRFDYDSDTMLTIPQQQNPNEMDDVEGEDSFGLCGGSGDHRGSVLTQRQADSPPSSNSSITTRMAATDTYLEGDLEITDDDEDGDSFSEENEEVLSRGKSILKDRKSHHHHHSLDQIYPFKEDEDED